MGRQVRLGEVLLGTEGAALFRHFLEADDDWVARRVTAIQELMSSYGTSNVWRPFDVPELEVEPGYEAWAQTYDTMSNALIRAEEPIVRAAVNDMPPGRALDAACGTGRHAQWLVEAGHATIGIDRTPAMLRLAEEKAPKATFRLGDLEHLDEETASFDVVVCSLALTHLPDPSAAIAELARVVRPGGRIVLSDAHPTFVLLQGQAMFPTGKSMAFVRNHAHLHSTYLSAFRRAGLAVVDCIERPMEADFQDGVVSQAAEAAESLWRDIPIALVWVLDRA